ncbi:hypothetical protein FK85_28465 [Halorubrum saccharovorum]|uniref:Uncharacterized protein n=1 Tax=Halorubrum saccharovorum TaxID=2248 RepID=A0A0F8BGY4_9EURY|nr:hypothetical protein FK85_28465 [Halorubrum saccharovorum]
MAGPDRRRKPWELTGNTAGDGDDVDLQTPLASSSMAGGRTPAIRRRRRVKRLRLRRLQVSDTADTDRYLYRDGDWRGSF